MRNDFSSNLEKLKVEMFLFFMEECSMQCQKINVIYIIYYEMIFEVLLLFNLKNNNYEMNLKKEMN